MSSISIKDITAKINKKIHQRLPLVSRPKPDTRICDHDRHANIKPKPDINKNQLNF